MRWVLPITLLGAAASSPPPTPPRLPPAVEATTCSSARLAWQGGGGATEQTLQRQYATTDGGYATSRGQWITVARLPASATAFTVGGLLGGTTYAFRVCDAGGQCTRPATATTPQPDPTARGMLIAPSNDTYPRNGEGSIVRDGGRLHYFFARFSKNADVGASVIVRKSSTDNGESWDAEAEQITPADGKGRANVGAVVLGPGHILLSYFVGVNHSSAFRVYRHTHDGGATWDPERPLTDGSYSYMTGAHDRLRRLSNGRLIITLHAREEDPEACPGVPDIHPVPCLCTLIFFSDDQGETWQRSPRPLQISTAKDWQLRSMYAANHTGEHGMLESALVERGTTPALRGHLLLLGRTSNGWLGQSLSSDYGSTWTAAVENTQLSHPQAPPNLALLPDGRLLLVTEPHFVPEEKMLVSAATVG